MSPLFYIKIAIVTAFLVGSTVGIIKSARALRQTGPTAETRIGPRERAFCDLYGSALTLLGTILYVVYEFA